MMPLYNREAARAVVREKVSPYLPEDVEEQVIDAFEACVMSSERAGTDSRIAYVIASPGAISGPFPTPQAAARYAHAHRLPAADSSIVALTAPDEDARDVV